MHPILPTKLRYTALPDADPEPRPERVGGFLGRVSEQVSWVDEPLLPNHGTFVWRPGFASLPVLQAPTLFGAVFNRPAMPVEPHIGLTLERLLAWENSGPPAEAEERHRAAARIRSVATVGSMGALKIAGFLDLGDFATVTTLPNGLHIGGSLRLAGCTLLRALPNELTVGGDLHLWYCKALAALPEELTVGGSLYMHDTAITRLPARLRVGVDLKIYGSPNPIVFPEAIIVGRDLDLQGCTGRITFAAGFTVGRDANMRGCRGLFELPARFTVRRDLNVRDCRGLSGVPADLSVGRDFDLRGCSGVRALPDEVLAWGPPAGQSWLSRFVCSRPRDIYLEDTGLSLASRSALEDMQPPPRGIHVHGGRAAAAVPPDFASVAEGVEFWWKAAPAWPATMSDLSTWGLSEAEARDLTVYLGRLRESADYRNALIRPVLAARVAPVLAALEADKELRAEALRLVYDEVTRCGDRAVLLLDQIELLILLKGLTHGEQAEEKLLELGLGLLKLEVVQRHAARAALKVDPQNPADAKPETMVESTEVYLAFQTRLRQRLNLPVSTHTMLYERTANVDAALFEAACADAMEVANNPAKVAAFLAAWEPWQVHQRRKTMASTPWASLPQHPLSDTVTHDAVCPISQEPYATLQKPVAVPTENTWLICDYDSFADWWIRHGTHPTLVSQDFALHRLRRPTGI